MCTLGEIANSESTHFLIFFFALALTQELVVIPYSLPPIVRMHQQEKQGLATNVNAVHTKKSSLRDRLIGGMPNSSKCLLISFYIYIYQHQRHFVQSHTS